MATASLVFTVLIAASFWHVTSPGEVDKLNVVATFYPLAYFAEEIGGDYVSVRQLLPDNTEVHSWEPSISDIVVVDDADILIYNGANVDNWFEADVLPSIDQSNKIIVKTTEGVELLETVADEIVDLVFFGYSGVSYGYYGHENGPFDPHTWISPFVAKQQAQKIHVALVQKDPEHEQYYDERWQDLKARFEQLDDDYMTGLSNTQREVIFVTHAAYGYLADRYGFEQHGVIGLTADEQPSASVIANLVEMMLDLETYVMYIDPLYSDEYAQTLKNTLESKTGQPFQVLTLYFMLGPVEGKDYFDQQKENLNNLKLGLEASS